MGSNGKDQKYLIKYYDSNASMTKYDHDLNEKETEDRLRELYLAGVYENDLHLYKIEEITPKIVINF